MLHQGEKPTRADRGGAVARRPEVEVIEALEVSLGTVPPFG
jgi:hypothetical protein